MLASEIRLAREFRNLSHGEAAAAYFLAALWADYRSQRPGQEHLWFVVALPLLRCALAEAEKARPS